MEPRVAWDQFLVSLFDPTAFDGMGLLFSKKAQKALNPQIQVLESRLIVVDITVNGVLTTLVNLYAPVGPKENATFSRKLTGRHWHRATPHVVAGDFNVTVNPLLDRPGQRTRINRRIDTTDFEAFVNRLAKFLTPQVWQYDCPYLVHSVGWLCGRKGGKWPRKLKKLSSLQRFFLTDNNINSIHQVELLANEPEVNVD